VSNDQKILDEPFPFPQPTSKHEMALLILRERGKSPVLFNIMSTTKLNIFIVLIVISSSFSCSEKSSNVQRNRLEVAAEIKDISAAATMDQMAIGDINTTSPSTLKSYQDLTFRLKNLVSEARKVGFTDAEINQLINEGKLEGRRAMLEIIQQSNR
jgi:hypothetical protein